MNGGPEVKIDRTALLVLLLLVAVAAIQFLHYYPRLPDTIATHFGSGGQANAWTGKGGFIASYALIEALFVAMAFGALFLLERVPVSMINLPKKDFWFSPERKRETLRYIASQMVWFNVVTLAFLIAVAQIIFNVNMGEGPPALPHDFFIVLVMFVGVIVWMSVRLAVRFSRPPA